MYTTQALSSQRVFCKSKFIIIHDSTFMDITEYASLYKMHNKKRWYITTPYLNILNKRDLKSFCKFHNNSHFYRVYLC